MSNSFSAAKKSEKQICISVIIPFYNAQELIARCIRNVQEQSLNEIEILLIDDGSTDSSFEWIDLSDPRIRVFRQKNMGPGMARNKGIQEARGEYIAFMDVDDFYPDRDALQKVYLYASEKNADICGGSLLIERNGHFDKGSDFRNVFKKEGQISFYDLQWDYGFYRYIYRRKWLNENEIYFDDLRVYEDPPFLIRAMLSTDKIFVIEDHTYCYRDRKKSEDYWDLKKVNDLCKGLLCSAEIADHHGLKILLKNIKKRVNEDYGYIILRYLDQDDGTLKKDLERIDELLRGNSLSDQNEIVKPLRFYGQSDDGSLTEKDLVGTLKGMIRSFRENGIRYTVDRILFHLQLKSDNDIGRTESKRFMDRK